MQSVSQKHTGPELVVRKLVHGAGFRFRLHRKDLPGSPDLVLPGRRKVIFVNGCFWHGHEGCSKGRLPKTRKEYWYPKILRNKARDAEATTELKRCGWDVLTVWQCETRDIARLSTTLEKFLLSRIRSTSRLVRDTLKRDGR